MGLSSSQARLLNLTARMHDIEYKAQNLEAQKLQMANESTQVYKEYENALNKQKVQFKQIGSDGSANYTDASISTLLENGYRLKLYADGIWTSGISSSSLVAGKLVSTWSSNITRKTIEYSADPSTVDYLRLLYGDGDLAPGFVFASGGNAYQFVDVYDDIDDASGGYIVVDVKTPETYLDTNSKEVLRNLVEAGFIVFEKPTNQKDENGNTIYAEVNIATDTSLQEVGDETELKKAEAKYEADMRKIDAKDKKFDTDLAAMETERNAIKTEMDTLKSVAKDNVDRTFKLFS